MSHRKLSNLIASVLVFGQSAVNGFGTDGSIESGYSGLLPLQATLRNEAVIGEQQIHRAYVATGTNTFALCVPEKFHMNASDPSKLVLIHDNYDYFLTVQVIAFTPGKDLSAEFCREHLSDKYPGAKIVGEFAQSAGPYTGPAFDLQWTNSNGVSQSARVDFIPSNAGIVEFILLCKSEKFSDGKRFFDRLRSSYCSDQSGPIKPIQTPKEPPLS